VSAEFPAGMRAVEFTTVGEASLRERWRVNVPIGADGDETLQLLNDALQLGTAEFIDEHGFNERDREIVEVDGRKLET